MNARTASNRANKSITPWRMPGVIAFGIACVAGATLAVAAAAPVIPAMPNPPGRELYFTSEGDGGWILRFDAAGNVAWKYATPMSRDLRVLPNGNLLFPYNENYDSGKDDNLSGVREIDPSGHLVFHFQTTGQVFSCDRAADGLTLVGAASQGKILFVDAAGTVVRTVTVVNKPGHACMRHVRALAGGNCLVAEESANAVREYDTAGRMIREIKVPFPAFAAARLANGHTVVSGRTGMVDVDANGSTGWQIEARNFPALGIRWCAGFQVLDNGDILLCNAGGKVPLIRFTPDGKVAWQSNTEAWPLPMGHAARYVK
jgi:hypothetical protein